MLHYLKSSRLEQKLEEMEHLKQFFNSRTTGPGPFQRCGGCSAKDKAREEKRHLPQVTHMHQNKTNWASHQIFCIY